jgi:hypothetical protein
MNLLAGKTRQEKIKIAAAAVLGVLAILFLYMAFGRDMFGGKTVAKAGSTPTPKPSPSSSPVPGRIVVPSLNEQNFQYMTIPIDYRGGTASAPDAGRNIFAFYEPPPKTPYSPTPFVEPKTPTPTPAPTPSVILSFVNPQSVYAGTKAFRMDIQGDLFTPDVRIYFQGSEMPTRFISAQQLSTDVPANFISQEGSRIIEVRSPDGKLWSSQFTFNVQAPPRPQFQYIGLIARKRANNDTAVFRETGKTAEFSGRLNDVLGGRFRLVSISSTETVFEDTSLGFKHKLALFRPPPGTSTGPGSGRGSFPSPGGTFNPPMPNPFPNPNQPQQDIPGIPNNIPRAFPQGQPANTTTRPTIPQTQKKDVDDNDDDDTDN